MWVGAANLEAIVFDKDGTLFDFDKTWLPGLREVAQHVAGSVGQPGLTAELLRSGGFVEGAVPARCFVGMKAVVRPPTVSKWSRPRGESMEPLVWLAQR